MTERDTRPNPYVGPRPFTAQDPLFARKREVRELRSLLVSERIVLLHSPSGAGKTSLIEGQGGLKQSLGGQYHIRPTIRVNQALPPGLPEAPGGRRPNRYTMSVLRSLEESPGPGGPLPLDELASLTLMAYLERRRPELIEDDGEGDGGGRTRRELLIVDQFEEVLSPDPRDEAHRREFFAELAEVLSERRRWALFVLREDFLGALQRWVHGLPTQLARRFRIDLLGEDGAREAIVEPALAQGVRFEQDALDQLVRELRRLQVQGLNGEIEQRPGLWIEPVQLQVVCRRLWSQLAPDELNIEREKVDRLGDVDSALAEFYAGQVAEITAMPEMAVSERAIREWVGTRLISVQGLRSQVMKGEQHSEGLPNRVIDALQNAHLVRAEERRGVRWYELAHDRLVGPVRRSNEAWFHAHLHPMQLQAALWMQRREPSSLLLGEEALQQAEEWAAAHGEALSADERTFLDKSREAREGERVVRQAQADALTAERRRAEEQARSAQRQRKLSAVIAVVGVLALLSAWTSYAQYRKAERALATAEEARQEASRRATEATEERRKADDRARAAREATRLAAARGAAMEGRVTLAQALLREMEAEAPMNDVPGWRASALETLERRDRAIVEFAGHTDAVVWAAFSPDGKRVVTASRDRTARTWDAATGDEIVAFKRHGTAVVAAAFSPDGTRVVSAAGLTAWVWDATTGATIAALEGHRGAIISATFSPDGGRVITASDDQTARVWEATTGAEVATLSGHAYSVRSALFSPNGAQIVTASDDEVARVWDAVTGKTVAILSGHRITVRSAAFSPDGMRIVTASWDKTARVWNAVTGRKLAVLEGHQDAVEAAMFSPDGTRVLTASRDGTAQVWDVAAGGRSITLLAHRDAVTAATFSPDGARIVTVSADKTVRVWDSTTGEEVATLAGVTAAFGPDGAQVVTASWDRMARIWDTEPGLVLTAFTRPHEGVLAVALTLDRMWAITAQDRATGAHVWDISAGREVTAVARDDQVQAAAFNSDLTRVVTMARDSTARVWDARTGERVAVLVGHQDIIESASFSADHEQIVTVSRDETARVWNAATGRESAVFAGHQGAVNSAEFSPDGARVVTASRDGTARVWNARTGDELAVSKKERSGVKAAKFSPDGKRVLTVTGDDAARVWDVATGSSAALVGHQDSIHGATFSLDGAYVVTASSDRTARIWDATTGKEIVALRGHRESVWTAEFSPDGRTIVTASGDQTARLWEAATGEEFAVVRGPGAAMVSASFGPDGRHVVAVSRDGTVRTLWAAAVGDDLGALRLLWRATALCPDPEERIHLLGVDPATATVDHEACKAMKQCMTNHPDEESGFVNCLQAYRTARQAPGPGRLEGD